MSEIHFCQLDPKAPKSGYSSLGSQPGTLPKEEAKIGSDYTIESVDFGEL